MSDFPSDRTTIADLLALSRTAGPEAAGALAARLGVRYVVCPRGASGYPQYRWDPRRERLVAVTDHPSGTAPRLTRMSRPRTDPRRVTWVNPVNPKAPGSGAAARFALWYRCATVDEFIAAGGTREDVRHDERAGHVILAPAQVPSPVA